MVEPNTSDVADPVDQEYPNDTAAVFSDLAEVVYRADTTDDVLQALCRTAPRVVAGCDHASLMLRRSDRFVTAAASDEVARRIDQAERELRSGPCFDALTGEAAQVDADLTQHSTWPELAAWVVEHTPVRGALAFRLRIDDEQAGALNLFSDTPGALSSEAADQAAVFAAFTSVVLVAANHNQRAESLRAGLDSNREIGKAVGLLMAFHKVSDDAAFDILRQTSQDLNIKLAEVAREVVDHHRAR